VVCTKLCIEDSIESKIIQLRESNLFLPRLLGSLADAFSPRGIGHTEEKKLAMTSATLNSDTSSMGKLFVLSHSSTVPSTWSLTALFRLLS
jgi:hypothetical protein